MSKTSSPTTEAATGNREGSEPNTPDPFTPEYETDPAGFNARRSEQAIRTIQEACAVEEAPFQRIEPVPRGVRVRRLTATAEALLEPGFLVSGAGEAVPQIGLREPYSASRRAFVDTLEQPNSVGVKASEKRLALLYELGLLEVGVDAAQTARAQNSIERMISHQIAGGHQAVMKLFALMPGVGGAVAVPQDLPLVEVTRLGHAAARLMEANASLAQALVKLKTHGRQQVVVQHQQLVVAQKGPGVVMHQRAARRERKDPGSRPRGRNSKNAR